MLRWIRASSPWYLGEPGGCLGNAYGSCQIMSKSASQWHVVETKVISLWHFERPVLGFASPLAKLCGSFSSGAPAKVKSVIEVS